LIYANLQNIYARNLRGVLRGILRGVLLLLLLDLLRRGEGVDAREFLSGFAACLRYDVGANGGESVMTQAYRGLGSWGSAEIGLGGLSNLLWHEHCVNPAA